MTTTIVATASVACAAWALVVVIARAALPYQLDYEEGNILDAAVRITHGLSPYPDPHALPNILNPYGPVIYVVVAGLLKLFGVTLVPGRMLVIAAGLAVAILLGLILRRETGLLAIGIAFGAPFLCSPFVQFWWPLLRVDLVGLALTLAGMMVFCRNCPTQTKGRLEWGTLVAGVLFVLAIYTKHTLIAAPAACLIWALLNQQKQSAIRLLATCFALGGGVFAIGEIATRGVLAFALFRMHPDPYLWHAYPAALRQLAEGNALLILLAAVLLVVDLWRKKISLPLLYLVLAALTALTIGKAGSNSNHLLEPMAALCLAAGAGWGYLAQLQGIRQLVPLAVAVLIAGQTIDRSRAMEFEPRNSACEQVIALIRQQPGSLILSENTGAVVLAGKTPLISNPFVYTQLVKYDGWSDGALVERLKAGSIPLVLMDASRRQLWSKPVMESLHANYRLVGRFDCRYAGLAFIPIVTRDSASSR